MKHEGNGALAEWRAHWTLPLAAMVGYSASVLHVYSLGPFTAPLVQEFGWSRTQVTVGLTISSLINAALGVVIGLLVDRVGARILGLLGVVAFTSAFGLFGTATGTTTNWILLWVVLGLANLLMQPTIWTKPVAARFEASRGLALAVTLAGAGVAASIVPLLASWLVLSFGWRLAFPALGAIWLTVALPITFLFFRSGAHSRFRRVRPAQEANNIPADAELPGLTVPEAFRSPAFYRLVLTGLLFVLTLIGVVVHFVPILTEHGASAMGAAATASLIGVMAILGRVGAGLLIDRLPAHRIGATIFLLPVAACLILLFVGSNPVFQVVAAICFGLTLGAEIDVLAFLTTRYLGLRNYGALFGIITSALGFGSAIGPTAAGLARDLWGSYDSFLIAASVLSVVSCLAIATLGPPRFGGKH